MREVGLSLDDDPSPTQPGGYRLADIVLLLRRGRVSNSVPIPPEHLRYDRPYTSAKAFARARLGAENRSARFLAESVLSVKIREK